MTNLVRDLKRVIRRFLRWLLIDNMPDTTITNVFFVELLYYIKHKKFVNIFRPRTFNAWLCKQNLFDRTQLKAQVTDKLYLKHYVAMSIGEKYTIPTIFCGTNPDDLDESLLPDKFIVKPTHSSGHIWVVRKEDFSRDEYLSKSNRWLQLNYFLTGREWVYKNLTPKIIVEPFMSEGGDLFPTDYKFFVFNGVVRVIQVDIDRGSEHTRVFFDSSWKALPFSLEYPRPSEERIQNEKCPARLKEILPKISRLAQPFKFIRVDAYIVDGQLYIGELTNFPGNGCETFNPSIWDRRFYEWFENN
jgi:hypothetical protein